jgi:hypothetical protein
MGGKEGFRNPQRDSGTHNSLSVTIVGFTSPNWGVCALAAQHFFVNKLGLPAIRFMKNPSRIWSSSRSHLWVWSRT